MKNLRLVVAPLPLLIAAAAALLAACKTEPPEPFAKDAKIDVQATVEAVDPVTRMVSLRGPNGPASVVAGPEVQNFDQIRVGDSVHVSYYAALAAQMKKTRGANGVPVEILDSYTAPPGARPGAGASSTIAMVVKIQSVDKSLNTVTFQRPDGTERTLPVESAEGQKFIRNLSPGDEVEVVYMEAVAIAVVPGRG
jgi:hypothetical protein